MRACSTASGGVMFIPDEIERKSCKVSYKELVPETSAAPKKSLFGRRKETDKNLQAAA